MIKSIKVTITNHNNKFLPTPVSGRMQITEVFLDGSISCAFQVGEYTDQGFVADGGPVAIHNPSFISTP